jgi:hypothetical protein
MDGKRVRGEPAVVPRGSDANTCQYHRDVERFMGEVDTSLKGLGTDMAESKADRKSIRDEIVAMKIEIKGAVTKVGLLIAAIALVVGPIITAIITKAMGPKGTP